MLLKPCAFSLRKNARVTRGLPHAVSSAPMASKVLPRFQPGCMSATTSSADADAAEPADRAAARAADGVDNAAAARAAEVVMAWRRVKPAELGIELSIESKGLPSCRRRQLNVEALRHDAGA